MSRQTNLNLQELLGDMRHLSSGLSHKSLSLLFKKDNKQQKRTFPLNGFEVTMSNKTSFSSQETCGTPMKSKRNLKF
jgi:hypothetical protein